MYSNLPKKKRHGGRILGLDILPGERQNPRFAAVIIDRNGNKIFQREISRSEIFDIIKEYNVSIIAIDNIFEIYPSVQEIKNFIKNTHIRLIQVTGPLGKEIKLSQLAYAYGLSKSGKLSPYEAAEIAARLALMDVGAEIKLFEDVTEIIVSRARSLGEGGQHQAKYARVIASVIQHAVREIEDILRTNNIQYDLFTREGDYGVKRARFIVYAPFEIVKQMIGRYHGDLFRVEIRPIEKEKISFLPTEKPPLVKRLLICGIDPGETTGVAILDLSGNILHISSRKNMGITNLLELIYEYGKPIIIASDVPKLPQFIEKICKRIGAICFSPSHVYSISDKNEMIRQLNVRVSNTHERDALVAAILAYKKYKNLFQKIDSIISYIPLNLDADEIKKKVVYGASVKEAISKAIENALKTLIEAPSVPKEKIHPATHQMRMLLRERDKLRKKISLAQKEIERLKRRIIDLENMIREKEKEIERLEELLDLREKFWRKQIREELDKLKNSYMRDLEKQLTYYKNVTSSLRKKLSNMSIQIKDLLRIIKKRENEIPIKALDEFTKDEIETLDSTLGITRGDIIYIRRPHGGGHTTAFELVKRGIRAIVIEDGELSMLAKKVFDENGIDILYPEDFDPPLYLTETERIRIITDEELRKALKNKRLRELPEDEALYEEVMDILNEWRQKRKKEEKGEIDDKKTNRNTY